MALTPVTLLVLAAFLCAIGALIPPLPGHHLLTVAVLFVCIALLAGVAVH